MRSHTGSRDTAFSRSGAVVFVEIGQRVSYLPRFARSSLSLTACRHRDRLRLQHFGDMECIPCHGTGEEIAGRYRRHVPCADGLQR
jgi:hypothetical protein